MAVGSEYDPVIGRDLGVALNAPYLVKCDVGRPQGPHTTYFKQSLRQSDAEWAAQAGRVPGT